MIVCRRDSGATDGETWRWGDGETWRRGDVETRQKTTIQDAGIHSIIFYLP
ncbi:MAG: hypothetical protein KFF73_01660 [Cyclobacteriaceae bacterium]|nr:hypothetical protein [Cyclobacteriaceae bacterium]